jgi:hypothetical protein
MSNSKANLTNSEVVNSDEITDLRAKLLESEQEVQQWELSYSNQQLLLIDLAKQIEREISTFNAQDDELKKEKYAHRCFKPVLEKLSAQMETVLFNAELTMRDVYPFKVNSGDSDEFKITVLLNELKATYTEHQRLAPKARLEKLLESKYFQDEAKERGIGVNIRALSAEAVTRITTTVNTDKRNGK